MAQRQANVKFSFAENKKVAQIIWCLDDFGLQIGM